MVPQSIRLAPTGPGLLTGKTFVAKDLISVAGHVSSFGNARWCETHTASQTTAPLLSKLLAEGGDLVGLAKLDMLAGSLVGNIGEGEAPLNSLYPDRFTGGSSSGSASAVAGDLVDFAIGTDTAGSVRVPAAACGLYGIRPTYGSINSEGVLPWAASFDAVGILSKDPRLIRDVYKVLSKKEAKSSKITKVLLPTDCLDQVSPEVAEVVTSFAQELAEKHDIKLQEIEFARFVSQESADLFSHVAGRDNWHAHGKWITANWEYLAPDLRARMEGAERSAADPQVKIDADMRAREDYRESVSQKVIDGSLLVMPILYGLSPKRDASADELFEYRKVTVRLNAVSGLSGLPEVVVPVIGSNNLRYGVGLIGAKNSDLVILDLINN